MKTIPINSMPLEIILRKVGNSLMLTLPADVAKLCGLHEGSRFEVTVQGDVLTLKSKAGESEVRKK